MSSENVLSLTTTLAMASSSFSIAAALTTAKNLLDVWKIKPFNGDHLKHWQYKIHDTLDVHKLVEYLTLSPSEEGCEDFDNKMKTWIANSKICRYIILSALSSNFCDIYYIYKKTWKIPYELWGAISQIYHTSNCGGA